VRAYIKELHRWAPIAPVGKYEDFELLSLHTHPLTGIPHETTEDLTYGDFFIPKGTILIPNIAALHTSPQKYPDPQTFRPERWMCGSSSFDGAVQSSSRDHYHYGFGKRMCPGSFVAEAMIFIAIARVLWAFEISPKGPRLNMADQRSQPPRFCSPSNH
jgi:cytochrome P450